MRNLYIYSHNRFSNGAASLARELGARRIKHEGSNFVGSARKTVINWGNANYVPDEAVVGRVINDTLLVDCAQDKFRALDIMRDNHTRVPDFTNRREVAETYINDGDKVVCRTLLRGSEGRGIVIASTIDELVAAPLYTRYVKKQDEYRVHVVNDNVIDVQKKAKRRDFPNEDVNYQVRSHANGFIYMREGITTPEDVTRQALAAVQAIGLDFGAVDVIWNNHQERAYVLEVNTAPGLEGQTVESYARALEEMLS